MPPNELSPLADQAALEFLLAAEIEIEGRMPWSSNATFLTNLTWQKVTHQAIYKPVRGERPLWDFEPGLHRRECAAYHLSHALGLQVVPPTVIREGAFGEGSVQWFVNADHSQHYFTIFENREDLHDQLRKIAIFDFVANNTDRKSGHCLIADDHIWGIDHGLCFAADFKLRTVIWEFAGEPIETALIDALSGLLSNPPASVTDLLTNAESDAMLARTEHLIATGEFPGDETGQRYPWPLV
jgi:uncharacterized repeat protein (TIGR03843 family)